jgi:DNA-binding NarL/FixJ family response regulator
MTDRIKIAIADDEDLFRNGIYYILIANDFEVVFEASNGSALMEYLRTNIKQPDVILMDIKMPLLNGVEATKQIANQYPNIKIIALSSYITSTFISSMLRVGAVSYIPKNASPEEMVTSINNVVEHGYYYNSFMRQHISQSKLNSHMHDKNMFDDNLLTKREYEILQLICKQKNASEIAELLDLSPRTIEGHRNNLLAKTESKNIAGLVLYAIRNKMIDLDDTIEF